MCIDYPNIKWVLLVRKQLLLASPDWQDQFADALWSHLLD